MCYKAGPIVDRIPYHGGGGKLLKWVVLYRRRYDNICTNYVQQYLKKTFFTQFSHHEANDGNKCGVKRGCVWLCEIKEINDLSQCELLL